MIVGKQKPLEEIWRLVNGYRKILVVGCNTCVAICHEGGNKEAEILCSLLRMKAKQQRVDMEIEWSGIERQCEHEYFEKSVGEIARADAVLSIACGAGTQFLGEKFPDKTVLPGLNTIFLGVVDAPGEFSERCLMCGDCILHLTGGICPVARCSKSLLNGPCGGSNNGSCEIDPAIPCAWQMIYDRLKLQGRIELIHAYIPARNWSASGTGGPRKFMREDIKKEKETLSGGEAE